jgi:hypothetical protein
MPSLTPAPLSACRSALIYGLLKSAPGTVLDEKGYVREASQNLIDGIGLEDFEEDLRQGDGNELKRKFLAAHSSSALAVNAFSPFKANLADLLLPAPGGFASLHFERKCPHGLVGRRSPNLDVLADGPAGVVAVESKCLEHLSRHKAKFAPAYQTEITDERQRTGWFREMQRLAQEPQSYRWLDAAQLIKHAFGLAYTFTDRPTTLLYLFWEPSNSEAYPSFAEHRKEVGRFAAAIAEGGPEFVAMSYPELWATWDKRSGPEWLPTHVSHLRARYGVSA